MLSMENFTDIVLGQEDFDPINVDILKQYLTKNFGDLLGQVTLI